MRPGSLLAAFGRRSVLPILTRWYGFVSTLPLVSVRGLKRRDSSQQRSRTQETPQIAGRCRKTVGATPLSKASPRRRFFTIPSSRLRTLLPLPRHDPWPDWAGHYRRPTPRHADTIARATAGAIRHPSLPASIERNRGGLAPPTGSGRGLRRRNVRWRDSMASGRHHDLRHISYIPHFERFEQAFVVHLICTLNSGSRLRKSGSCARIGQPVDVGGRTLNHSSRGEGSPTVILESGRGIGWKALSMCWRGSLLPDSPPAFMFIVIRPESRGCC